MPLEVQPLTDTDVPTFIAVQDAALGASGIGRCLHAQPLPASYVTHQETSLRDALRTKPRLHYLKVVDTETGEILAGAKWEVFEQGRSDEELAKLDEPVETLEEEKEHAKAQQEFFGYLNAERKSLGKTPHYVLHLLITHPNYHRRGAGSMLLRWGTERADKAGLISYLEATETGRPLYKRYGFEDVKTAEFDLSRYGGQGIEKNTTMIRQPQTVKK